MFDDDCAAEEGVGLYAEYCDDGDEVVVQCVLGHDEPLGEFFCVRGVDVVLFEHFEYV